MIEVDGLTVRYGGVTSLDDMSLAFEQGTCGLIGPNGAGKTTFFNVLSGFVRPATGTVRAFGVDLTKEQAQSGRDRVLELFPQLGKRLTATARTLSGGEQQMVVLAQALIGQPRYLLIDELSLGLAPVVVSRLIPVIRAVAESGAGVLLIEQFATVALGLAHRAHIMEGGRIRFSGLASELRDQPDLLRSAYLLRGSEAEPPAVPLELSSRTGAPRAPATPRAPAGKRPRGPSPL
jgi:branched-chain amino acid transport system ATP-binding protein